MACLDTSAFLDLLGKGGPTRKAAVKRILRELVDQGEDLTTSRFTEAELWVGVERSIHRDREEAAIIDILTDIEVLEFDQRSARLFGLLTAHLQKTGTPTGDMDVLIASVSLANAHPLVTANGRHFRNMPDLHVISYG